MEVVYEYLADTLYIVYLSYERGPETQNCLFVNPPPSKSDTKDGISAGVE